MATYNFEKPNFSKEHAEIEEYLRRFLNELEHLPESNSKNGVYNSYKTEITEVYEDSSIEEESTFANGTYRKWKSGLAELWGTVNVTIGNISQWGGVANFIMASDDSYSINYPSLFVSAPSVQATIEKDNTSVWLATVSKGTSVVSPSYKILGQYGQGLSGQTATIHFYATGRWK